MLGRRKIATVASVFGVSVGLLVFAACDATDEQAGTPKKVTPKPDATVSGDGATAGGDAMVTIPGLCAKAGGFAKVQALSDQIYNAAAADCRVGVYFTRMGGQQQGVVKGCMQKQLGEIFGCPNIVYAGSNVQGHECRGMTNAHNDITSIEGKTGLNSNDYIAYVQATQGAMKAAGFSDGDITSVVAVFNGYKQSVAPRVSEGNTYCTCPGNQYMGTSCVPDGGYIIPVDGGPDAPLDTGTIQDTGGGVDADDSG